MERGTIPVEDIPLSVPLKSEVVVCLLQLEIPLETEMYKSSAPGGIDRYKWRPNAIANRTKRITSCISSIGELIKDRKDKNFEKVDIFVLPEYSVNKTMVNGLQDIAKRYHSIIVAGVYDDNEYSNKAAVILPDGNIYYQYKLSKSTPESGYLNDPPDAEKKILRFTWYQINGKPLSFSVFICSDFMKYSSSTLNEKNPQLIIVPMCSHDIRGFYCLSDVLIRTAQGHCSTVVALCNSVEAKESSSLKVCGKSQFIGPTIEYSLTSVLAKSKEGAIIAKLKFDLELIFPLNPSMQLSFDDAGKIEDSSASKDTCSGDRYVINPNVIIKKIEQNKMYALYHTHEYYDVRNKIKKAPLKMVCHGILGVHDLMFQGYAENVAFFKQRIESYLKDGHSQLKEVSGIQTFYTITDVIKYRNINLVNITSDIVDDNGGT
ncbi:MAG: carbon-nitrogen hydrolase family protein [Nitrospirae bacterium]|uniref:hypothetical protein n=1 Tax=Candidatus Magnetominusculus dajiuhuensis TaxID=3137712 RepID=UPI001A089A5D|nr:carbon-nitrogen hydrolase family protein [Nitrospirota bacterium]